MPPQARKTAQKAVQATQKPETPEVAPEPVPAPETAPERPSWPPQGMETKKDRREGVPPGRILQMGEPDRFEATDMGSFIRVDEDVYREVYPRSTKRPHFILLHRKGEEIPKYRVSDPEFRV